MARASCCREREEGRPRSYDSHIFAITSPPDGVHIFAWLASFRNFTPKPCIFSLTTPVRLQVASSQLYFNLHLQLETPYASKRCEQCILPSWAEVLQSVFAICNCSQAIQIQLPLGRETAGCICNLELQPSQSQATYECSGPSCNSNCSRARSCNCSRDSAIAAEILQLQPRVLGCNSRLQMHSAGPPPKRRLGVGMARLQFQIANALCSLAAHKGFTPTGRERSGKPSAAACIVHLHSGIAGQPSLPHELTGGLGLRALGGLGSPPETKLANLRTPAQVRKFGWREGVRVIVPPTWLDTRAHPLVRH